MGHCITWGQVGFHLPFASTLCYCCDGRSPSAAQRTRQGGKLNKDAAGIMSSLPGFTLVSAGELDAIYEAKHLQGLPHQCIHAKQHAAGAQHRGC